MRTFTLPTVSLNGSSAHELLDQQLRVLRAISARSDFNETVDALELIKERAQALAVHLSESVK